MVNYGTESISACQKHRITVKETGSIAPGTLCYDKRRCTQFTDIIIFHSVTFFTYDKIKFHSGKLAILISQWVENNTWLLANISNYNICFQITEVSTNLSGISSTFISPQGLIGDGIGLQPTSVVDDSSDETGNSLLDIMTI